MSSRIVYTPGGSPRARPRRRIVILTAASIGVILAVAGIVYVLRLPPLQIKELEFYGLRPLEEHLLQERVLAGLAGAYAYFVPHSFYYAVDSEALARRLREEFPRLENVQIAKEFPDKLILTATERSFWGIFCASPQSSSTPQCVYIDPSGFAYDDAPEMEGSLILDIYSDGGEAVIGKPAVDTATMELFQFLAEKTAESAGAAITGYELRTRVPSEIRVKVADGFTVIFDRNADFTNSFRVLKRVLDDEIKEKRGQLDYIDLRFGNKVFYKLRS